MKRAIAVMLVLVSIPGLSVVLWSVRYLDRPLAIPPQGYEFVIAPGSTMSSVANSLAEDRLLEHPSVLSGYARLTGLAGRIHAGEYELPPGLSARELLDQLVEGRVKLHDLTIIEGWTVRDVLNALRKHPAVRNTLEAPTAEMLAEALELDADHAEGQFFPDTYRFARGTTDRELLERAGRLMQTHLAEQWAGRAVGLPLRTPYEALILASIVERETALESERPLIAGVFVRRLQRGMRLQTDPTVIYGLGDTFDGDIRRTDLETDTPYNTYTRDGLPPTPIAMPGLESIAAVMHPADGDALYFVATGLGDGSHVFTATLEEHNAAVRTYLARLRARDSE